MLKVVVYVGKLSHHAKWCSHFVEGLSKHGLKVLMTTPEHVEQCDVAVFWSHKFEACQAAAENYIVLENGYAGDGYVSAGWNGLNGRADFCNQNVPDDRGEQLAGLMKDYHAGDYYLIMGQCRGDAALRGLDFEVWADAIANTVCEELAENDQWDKPVYFRPHPKDPEVSIEGIPTLTCPYDEALAGAHQVITYNSNSAVDALLAGCAASVSDRGSMAWDVAGKGIEYRRVARRPWLNRLAYCQWTAAEMEKGLAWDHLRSRLE